MALGGEKEELCAGYLYKSPQKSLFKLQKSWKRRYFVLLKKSKTTCHLKYFNSEEVKKSEPIGAIDLSQVSLMFLNPEIHYMWKWVQEIFRCSPSCVLFMKVADREYFLIGETSSEIERWFFALYDAMNNRPHKLHDLKETGRIRDISAPRNSLKTYQRVEWRLDASSDSDIPSSKEDQHEKDVEDQLLQRINFCFSKDYYSVQMFSKLKNSANQNAKFYEGPANIEEVQSGYMYKSPPQTFFRSLKSWKRRYFVLSKTPANHYELKFFKDENRRAKPLGQINLYQVSLFFRQAESHPIWLWIQKNFRCSVSCVLYMRLPEREYFLIGENSCEIEAWFNAIFKALNTHLVTLPDSEEIRKNRSLSEPSVFYHDRKWFDDQEQKESDPNPSSLSTRQSAPESFNCQYAHYDYPKNYKMTAPQYLESEDTEEDEQDEVKINKESEPEEDTSCYMDMDSVRAVMRQPQKEDVLYPQTNLEGNNFSENSFLLTGNEDSGSTALNSQISPGSETSVPVEKEICLSQDELKNSVIILEEAGRLCVSNWRQSSGLFHEGDQILAINDLLTDSLAEFHTYIKRLSKDQVKLTILRQPGSQPLSG
ncbi:hypothetical protein PGIGA_G00037540 [Pangasianodon gigas]|uniref:Uncharacterized protein n=1 Tax=Pangasianodon gigas TaxID=30993 RepID=A0ACC5WZ23_PANGG|nr:hypothetical protein [Pangasianodon gigas]